MNGKKYALLLALPLLALSSCGGELTSSSDLSSSLPSTLPQDEEREHFEDPLLETNIQSLLKLHIWLSLRLRPLPQTS